MFEWCMSRAEVTFAVRVRPGASRTSVGGSYDGALGPAVVVAVREPAVDGRANKATLAAIARALGLTRGQVELRTGDRGRDKLITVLNAPTDLSDRLRALRDGGAA
jgi:uncharacterized protein YggU (UPF0235/DUF167 family)